MQQSLLAALVLVAYGNSLDAGFHLDDWTMLSNPDVAGPATWRDLLHPGAFRPLTTLTFRWSYQQSGQHPEGWHWANLLLHFGNSALVLLIARRYLAPFTAALVATVFAVHPLQTEAVTYIVQRASLLAAFLALWAFLLYEQGRLAWSAALFVLSLLAKEETIALAAIPPLLDYVKRERPRPLYYAGLLAIAGVAAVRLFWSLARLKDTNVGFTVEGVPNHLYALTQPRVIWSYLRLVFLPVGQNLEHDPVLSRGLLEPWTTLPALLLLSGALVALAIAAWKRQWPCVWILAFFVLLSPSSSVVAAADLMFEHRLYFPLFALLTGLGWLAERQMRRGALVALAVTAVVACSALAVIRNRVWRDEVSLWSDVIAKSPNRPGPYIVLGLHYSATDPARAREYFERGLSRHPDHARLHINLGALLLPTETSRALEHLRKARDLGGENAVVLTNIGAGELLMGNQQAGERSVRRALEIDPCYVDAHRVLMGALLQAGRKKEAYEAANLPAGCRALPEAVAELHAQRQALFAGP